MNRKPQFFDLTAEDEQRMIDAERRTHRQFVCKELRQLRQIATEQNAMLLRILNRHPHQENGTHFEKTATKH